MHRLRHLLAAIALSWSIGVSACDAPPEPAGIIVDGKLDDWETIPVAVEDPLGDHLDGVVDFGRLWLANDETHIFVRIEFDTIRNLQKIKGRIRAYFDVDRNPATGWPIGNIGSDFAILFPERHAIEQSASAFSVATIGQADVSLESAPTVGSAQFEFRIARDTMFPVAGTPVFANSDFDVILEAWTVGAATDECNYSPGVPVEYVPDGPVGLAYAFTDEVVPPYRLIPLEKEDPRFVRLVSYNVLFEGLFVRPDEFRRILQALQPDIICFQELWTHSAADVRELMDQWLPLGVGEHWRAFKANDSITCSRWELKQTASQTVPAGPNSQAMALIDLPDSIYRDDLYVVNTHLTCCGCQGSARDVTRQIEADANVNWLRDARSVGGSIDLKPNTPFVLCGDLNMVGGPQPLDTLLTGNIVNEDQFGMDSPPDWDASPISDAFPLHAGGPFAYTWRDDKSSFGPSRLDFVLFSDSVLEVRKSFVLWTPDLSAQVLASFGLLADDTAIASDHLPVVVDFYVP